MRAYQADYNPGEKPTNAVSRFVHDGLKTFRAFQVAIAAICILIPVFLRSCDYDSVYPPDPRSTIGKITDTVKECGFHTKKKKICKYRWGFRASLSEYAYSSNSYVFGFLYTMAAMMFIFNGAVHFRCRNKYNYTNQHGQWYNVFLGLTLIGVVLEPMYSGSIWHYVFAVLFFAGNIVVIAFLHKKKNRVLSIVLSTVALLALILSLVPPKPISILAAEWISLIAIAIYLITDSLTPRESKEITNRIVAVEQI